MRCVMSINGGTDTTTVKGPAGLFRHPTRNASARRKMEPQALRVVTSRPRIAVRSARGRAGRNAADATVRKSDKANKESKKSKESSIDNGLLRHELVTRKAYHEAAFPSPVTTEARSAARRIIGPSSLSKGIRWITGTFPALAPPDRDTHPWCMVTYEIRGATAQDEDQLLEVAHHLNTVNLPADRAAIRRLVELSERSFTGDIQDVNRREYVFALVDRETNRIVGTSMVIAQLGRRDAPYIYLDVIDEERYSSTLDKHFKHTALSIGYSYNGPTEIGGLIVHPEYRKKPDKLGLMISYVRFLYIRMHREVFQNELLAELLPPLGSDGTSHLWDALGRHFTGLTYGEADRLSKQNKEFIRGLFPEGTIYASLLTPHAQEVIGKVGAQTRGVEKMLRRIGFRYAERVDPFDGGPHFTAPTDEVTLVQQARKLRVGGWHRGSHTGHGVVKGLVAVETANVPYFRAVPASYLAEGDDSVRLEEEIGRHLGLEVGAPVWCLPLH
jgi:arginine N-succinyltransferase